MSSAEPPDATRYTALHEQYRGIAGRLDTLFDQHVMHLARYPLSDEAARAGPHSGGTQTSRTTFLGSRWVNQVAIRLIIIGLVLVFFAVVLHSVSLSAVGGFAALLGGIIAAATRRAPRAGPAASAVSLADRTARTKAYRAKRLSESLLGPQMVNYGQFMGMVVEVTDQSGSTKKVLDRVYRDTVAIRTLAVELGLDHRWDFSAVAGTVLRADYQAPFGRCDPSRPVEFVVFPAFLVEGRVFCRQRVFTTEP
jgi:hypothetical protein